MPTMNTKGVFDAEDEIFTKCTPFPLVQKRKRSRKKRETTKDTAEWVRAFDADFKMSEGEAVELVDSHNARVFELFDQTMQGDQVAAVVLVEYANVAIQALEQIANQSPRILHPISHQHIRWPAFIGPKDFQLERNQNLIKELELGEKSAFKHKWNPNSPATFTAYSMLYWLVENQAQLGLPPLSKGTVKVWFEVGWEGFSKSLSGRPEKYSYLRQKVEMQARNESARKQEKRNLETVIRTEMKDALRQSFRSVTRKLPL